MEGALLTLANGNSKQLATLRATMPIHDPQCMQVLRIQMPHTLGFITRLTYYIQLNENSDFKCCRNSKRIKWISLDHILNQDVQYLWGPELVDFSRLICRPTTPQVIEYSLEEAFLFVPRDPPRNPEEGMLKSINITEKDVERLYIDFIEHCFPSFSMTLDSFKAYMAKYGFEKSDHRLLLLFRAFNCLDNGYLSFHELLIGLATIEPFTTHGQVRTRFLFRYYTGDSSGVMGLDKFRKLVRDINPTTSSTMLDKKVAEGIQIIGIKNINGVEVITAEDFFQAIGSHKFRGTANLCRSSKPIFTQISRKMAARTLKKLTARQSVGSVIKTSFQGKQLNSDLLICF